MVKMNHIEELGRSIGREFNATKVILFGSYAYGNPLQGSDVDLLVIMEFKGKGVWKSLEIMDRLNPRFGVDLIVRTPEQVKQRLEWNDFFMKDVIEKGKVLYEADHE